MSRVPLMLRMSTTLAMRAWFTPPGRREASVRSADGWEVRRIDGPTEPTEVRISGEGPLVLVLHGWGANPHHLDALAAFLVASGHRVAVPHLPGRAGSRPTDIVQVAGAVRRVIDVLGDPDVVVAHSFGAMVARLVFEAQAPAKAIYLAPLVKVSDALDTFSDWLRLAPWARRGIHRSLEEWNPELWPTVNTVRPEQLPGAELLILHDPEDMDTSFARAAALAALRPRTTIVPVESVGHRGIVSDLRVLEAAGAFLCGADTELLAG